MNRMAAFLMPPPFPAWRVASNERHHRLAPVTCPVCRAHCTIGAFSVSVRVSVRCVRAVHVFLAAHRCVQEHVLFTDR